MMRRLLPLLLVSCAGISPPAHAPLDREPTAAERRTRPTAAREARQERWILRRGDTEIVFTLLVEFEEGLRYVAIDDFGAVLADSEGRASRIVPKSLADRIGVLLTAMYAPADLRPVRVGSEFGWASPGVLWIGDEIYVGGMRVRRVRAGRYEVEGALSATVTVG